MADESYKALNKIYWEEAQKLIEKYKKILHKKHFESSAGVNYIDFDDYYHKAIHITYKLLKKYNIYNIEDSDKYNKKLLLSEIFFRLQDYMFTKRDNIKSQKAEKDYQIYTLFINDEDTHTNIINNYTIDPLCSNFLIKEEDNKESNEELNNILSILDERSIYIIKQYIGFDSKNLTFKEIGEQLGLSESLIARKYKKAIQLLQKNDPPDKEQELRKLIFKT